MEMTDLKQLQPISRTTHIPATNKLRYLLASKKEAKATGQTRKTGAHIKEHKPARAHPFGGEENRSEGGRESVLPIVFYLLPILPAPYLSPHFVLKSSFMSPQHHIKVSSESHSPIESGSWRSIQSPTSILSRKFLTSQNHFSNLPPSQTDPLVVSQTCIAQFEHNACANAPAQVSLPLLLFFFILRSQLTYLLK